MKFAVIPPGQFKMGDGSKTVDVTVTKAFRLGIHEVTQGQWKAVMGGEPWKGQDNVKEGADVAASYVSWNDAAEFCRQLTKRERADGRLAADAEYRLPTEAEWEAACRAGTTTKYWFLESKIQSFIWFETTARNGGEPHPHTVGLKPANPWGLYEIHGNVMEWCADWHSPDVSAGTDPVGPASGTMRLLKGGSWSMLGHYCTSGSRFRKDPSTRSSETGFRVVLQSAVGKGIPPATAVQPNSTSQPPPPAVAPFDEAQAKAHQEAWAKYLGEPVETTNSIGMKLAVIPPGSYTMGSVKTPVDVTLNKPFRLGVHEVTQGQYKAVMGSEPWKGKSNVLEADDVPASHVTWTDAEKFCRKLTQWEREAGRIADDAQYRLPTDAEWEWACRAGTTTKYSFGDDAAQLEQYGWFLGNAWGRNEKYAHAVGRKKPNLWGLYDMHGNVSELCSDWWTDRAGLAGGTDPTGPADGKEKVRRGGNFEFKASDSESIGRLQADNYPRAVNGFRVVLQSPVAQGASPATADRAVAEWYLGLGTGRRLTIETGDTRLEVEDLEKLPAGPLKIVDIYMHGEKGRNEMSDADFQRLVNAGLEHVETITFAYHQAPLEWIAALQQRMPSLKSVGPFPGHVDYLKVIQDFPNLERFRVSNTDIGDDWAEMLSKKPTIRHIDFALSGVSAAGLAHLADSPKLEMLTFDREKLDDACLTAISKVKGLRTLSISPLPPVVTEAGFLQLASLENLDTLTLREVPTQWAKSLQAKLPHCTIVYSEPGTRDRVTLEGAPRPDTSSIDPDRAAAKWVIAMGGNVKVSTAAAKDQMVSDVDKLPAESFQVTVVDLAGAKDVDDAGLQNLAGLAEMHALRLTGTSITDAGVAHLKGCEKLTYLAIDEGVSAAAQKALTDALPDLKLHVGN